MAVKLLLGERIVNAFATCAHRPQLYASGFGASIVFLT